MTIPSKLFLVTTKDPVTIFGMHTKNKTHIVGFKNRKDAVKCKYSMAKYRKSYGIWPQRFLANHTNHDSLVSSEISDNLSTCFNLMKINYTNTKELIDHCHMTNCEIIVCDELIFGEKQISVKGIQIHVQEPSIDIITQLLEQTYTN